ncbi:MAG: hypothetical protein CTY16_03490 [Methylobacter sp.]|nr:MAG: hypothetical protein CTY16_03490 [Methylobacter sp.]
MKHKLLASFKNTWRNDLSLHLPIAPFANQSQDKNHYSARRSSPLFLVLVFWVLLSQPTLVVAKTIRCLGSSPEDFISGSDLIFKGQVIDIKKIAMDKFDVTTQYEKIWSKNDVSSYEKQKILVQMVKPFVDAELFEYLTEKPHEIEYIIKLRTRFKVLLPYKGPALDEVEVNGSFGEVGEEQTVFAYGSLQNGYSNALCSQIHFRMAYEENDPSFQNALDSYKLTREKLAASLKLSPHNAALLKEQGAFFLHYEDLNDSEWAYRELLWHHPKDIVGWVGLAGVKFHRTLRKVNSGNKAKAQFEQVLTDYRNILKIDRNNPNARHGETLSLLYLERGSEVDKNARDFSGYINHSKTPNDFFAGRNLVGANFGNAELSNFNFSKADLRHADFSGATLRNCDFTGATLANATFRNLKETYGTKFIGANLQHADFTQANLEKVDFSNADLQGADFTKAALNRSLLAGAKLNNAKFSNANVCIDISNWPIGFDPLRAGVKNCK